MKSREITKRYRLSEWAKIIQERSETGEKINEFLLRKGITKDSYYYWLRKLRRAADEQLTQQPKQSGLAVRGFTEVRISDSPITRNGVGTSQICIETGICKITADAGYPTEPLVKLLREAIRP